MTTDAEQELLGLLAEDDFGLWEVESLLKQQGFDPRDTRDAAQRLWSRGVIEVIAKD